MKYLFMAWLVYGAVRSDDQRVSGWCAIAATAYGVIWFTGGLS